MKKEKKKKRKKVNLVKVLSKIIYARNKKCCVIVNYIFKMDNVNVYIYVNVYSSEKVKNTKNFQQ